MSICEIRGRISCARNFCEFREFRGRTSEGGVGMAGCHTLLRKLPQISQIYTETFSKKVLCALRILWEFLYTNLEWKICGKQPLHQPSHQYKPKGVQRSPLHQPNNLYKTTKAEALTFALVLFSPSAPTDTDIRTDRRRHPQRPTRASVSTDADIRIDRRRCS